RLVFRCAGLRRARCIIEVLVLQAELPDDPERADAARARRTIETKHAFPPGAVFAATVCYEGSVEGNDMTETRPVLAVTMGDPAGIGPEIAVRALLSPEVRACSRSFLIGDARVFGQALSVCGLYATLNQIPGPEAITDRDGFIDVMHQDTADPATLQIGKVQALGGEAAYAAIRASIDLAMAGRIA